MHRFRDTDATVRAGEIARTSGLPLEEGLGWDWWYFLADTRIKDQKDQNRIHSRDHIQSYIHTSIPKGPTYSIYGVVRENFSFDTTKVIDSFFDPQKFKIPYLTLNHLKE